MLTKTITANASRTKTDTPAVEPISTRIKPGSASRSSPSPASLGASGSSWTSAWERDELKRPNSFLDESNSTAELTFGPSRIQRCHRCWFEDSHRPMSTENWTLVVVLSVDCKNHKPEAFSHQLTFLGSTIRPGVVSVQPPQTQWPASEWSRDERKADPLDQLCSSYLDTADGDTEWSPDPSLCNIGHRMQVWDCCRAASDASPNARRTYPYKNSTTAMLTTVHRWTCLNGTKELDFFRNQANPCPAIPSFVLSRHSLSCHVEIQRAVGIFPEMDQWVQSTTIINFPSAIIGLPFQRRDHLMPNCQSRNKITCLFSVDGSVLGWCVGRERNWLLKAKEGQQQQQQCGKQGLSTAVGDGYLLLNLHKRLTPPARRQRWRIEIDQNQNLPLRALLLLRQW
ncbi:hypothetical protein T01_10854 [Trichinella spiralis]|uniref:Uncharacterized protein n=1 Tax=Trichinella spiralis TaxID=6334 RepID=A0A0V1BQD5_TRISP|nr:hypothetical protein T01_10854 [Trichinella spiralis]